MSNVHPPLTIHCGDDWEFSGPLNDSVGNPLPLSGASFVWKLDSLDLTTNYITLTNILVTDQSKATVFYGPTAAQTAALLPRTYYDTLRVTLAPQYGGGTFTVVEGQINAAPNPA